MCEKARRLHSHEHLYLSFLSYLFFFTNTTNHRTDHQDLKPQVTAEASIKSIYSCYHLGSKSFLQHTVCTHAYELHHTLATCRGFCCSAPPCSLKPHGEPPERETTISSATIPAPCSQPAVCVCLCLSCSPLLPFLTLCEYQ